MERYDWERLSPLQVGKFAEYSAKMEFTLWGFDVFSAEVDEHGVDFVVRMHPGPYFDVQVKSARGHNYIFLQKDKFRPNDRLLAAIVLFQQLQPPSLYVIPSTQWLTPNKLLATRDYEGKKSLPEWGINLSQANMPILENYSFDRFIKSLPAGNGAV
ncbi:MAG: DUF4365 domain-containing protein [Anaerolineales bacterium]|jgi:hypothetical protein